MAIDKLFNLIHSLEGHEKKYFKSFAEKNNLNSDPVYLQLFDAIDKSKHYEEDRLKLLFPDKIQTFPKLKKYLYDNILKSISFLAADSDERSLIYQHLITIHVLHKKMLYEEALELIERSKLMAVKNDYQLELLKLYSMELMIYNARLDKQKLKIVLEHSFPNSFEIIDNMKNWFQYRELYTKYRAQASFYVIPGSKDKILQEIFSDALLMDETFPKNIAAKRFFHELNYIRAKQEKQSDLEIYHLKKLISLYEKEGIADYQAQSVYMAFLYNLALTYFVLKDEKEVKHYVKKLEDIVAIGRRNEIRNKDRIFYIKLLMAMEWSDAASCDKLISVYETDIKTYHRERDMDKSGKYSSTQLIMIYQIRNGNFYTALTYINDLINDKDLPILYLDMYSFFKITNLIIHYELGNYDILTNLIRQADYFLVKHSRRYGVESELIQFFKIILKTPMFEKEKVYKKLILRLEELALDPNEQMQIDFLRQANWPYSRLTN